MIKRLCVMGLAACFVCCAIPGFYRFMWAPHFVWVWNVSESLPHTFYWVVKGQRIHRGDVVSFYPPPNRVYGTGTPFLKRVGGVAGDVVKKHHHLFTVNGVVIGLAKTHTRTGGILQDGPTGHIGKGQIFVYTPHKDSFDSRYRQIGRVPADRIIGRAYPLL